MEGRYGGFRKKVTQMARIFLAIRVAPPLKLVLYSHSLGFRLEFRRYTYPKFE